MSKDAPPLILRLGVQYLLPIDQFTHPTACDGIRNWTFLKELLSFLFRLSPLPREKGWQVVAWGAEQRPHARPSRTPIPDPGGTRLTYKIHRTNIYAIPIAATPAWRSQSVIHHFLLLTHGHSCPTRDPVANPNLGTGFWP